MIRGTAGNMRFFIATTTQLVEEARRRHNTLPTATAALGRLLTGALLMGYNLKNDELITVRLNGDGILGPALATANGKGEVRGYVANPNAHLPSKAPGKLNVGAAVGKGTLHVMRDMGLKERYESSVELHSGEIGDDLAKFYLESEQIPTAVGVGVLVDTDNSAIAAGGFILQALPGATEEDIRALEKNIAGMAPISTLVHEGKTPEDIAAILLTGISYSILDEKEVSFRCNCSKDRFGWILGGLAGEDLQDLASDDKGVDIHCHFCGENYHFNREEITAIAQKQP